MSGERRRPPVWLHHVLTWAWWAVTLTLLSGDLLVLGTAGQVLAVRVATPSWTMTMLDQAWQRGAWPAQSIRPLDQLGTVPDMMIAAEDQRFWTHHGFDLQAMRKAIEHNKKHPERPRGGSTITQQVARNVFLWQERSWLRKGLEAWYTLLLEALLPKARILELYANVAETGPNTFGVEAGAQHWFKRSANRLNATQSAQLAALLPSPRKWRPDGERVQRRARWILAHPVARAGAAPLKGGKKP